MERSIAWQSHGYSGAEAAAICDVWTEGEMRPKYGSTGRMEPLVHGRFSRGKAQSQCVRREAHRGNFGGCPPPEAFPGGSVGNRRVTRRAPWRDTVSPPLAQAPGRPFPPTAARPFFPASNKSDPFLRGLQVKPAAAKGTGKLCGDGPAACSVLAAGSANFGALSADGWTAGSFRASEAASEDAGPKGAERCASANDSCCSNRREQRPRAAKHPGPDNQD
jgi:hypothetical protein